MRLTKFWKLYPSKTKSHLKDISKNRLTISRKKIFHLQKFGKDYFDGRREHGYGGYYYNKKYFRKIVKEMIKHYKLNNNSKILDIGCAKGFMMYEFKYFLPKSEVLGIDISKYCKKHALKSVKNSIKVCNCINLPFEDNYFDFVVSISTIHNLKEKDLPKAIMEINRVKKNKGKSFIRVKGHKNLHQKKVIDDWNLVAKSNPSTKKWIQIFNKTRYSGDYDFAEY